MSGRAGVMENEKETFELNRQSKSVKNSVNSKPISPFLQIYVQTKFLQFNSTKTKILSMAYQDHHLKIYESHQ